jgi:hypothetical protein
VAQDRRTTNDRADPMVAQEIIHRGKQPRPDQDHGQAVRNRIMREIERRALPARRQLPRSIPSNNSAGQARSINCAPRNSVPSDTPGAALFKPKPARKCPMNMMAILVGTPAKAVEASTQTAGDRANRSLPAAGQSAMSSREPVHRLHPRLCMPFAF